MCHTYYHVFVACIKELNKKCEKEPADLVLSLMSTNFEQFAERLKNSDIFRNVFLFDEKRESFFPEVARLKEDSGNVATNMYRRILFTKKFAKAQEEFVPVNFRGYKDVYVFCDADPIGYYLNQNRIYYHAVEDGLDTLSDLVQAKYDNRSLFWLKKFFSMKLNLIFIRDGYSKYCLDMEVNDLSRIDDDFKKYKEVPRNELMDALDASDRETIIRAFVRNIDELRDRIKDIDHDKKNIIILTEPLCSLDVRKKIFEDLIAEYSKEGNVFLKPHPRDELDYSKLFESCPKFDRTIPMEIFNFFEDIRFDKVISVYTELGAVRFAKEKVMLGNDFMYKYEEPSVHRKKVK